MALVCDIKSDTTQPAQPEPLKEIELASVAPTNEDLEDGEIEDDDEETPEPVPEQAPPPEATPPQAQAPAATPNPKFSPNENKFGHNNRGGRFDRPDRHNRHEERKRGHLTEAEKSVLHLHKLERIERLEREKRDRYKREAVPVVDDFACNIEKAIASVLKKDKKGSDEEKEEEDTKRGKKRKKKDKDKEKKKAKQRKLVSPKPEEFDESEMMNVRRGSPDGMKPKDRTGSSSPRSDYDSYDSSTSSDRSREDRKDRKKEHGKKGSRSKNRDRVRGDRKSRDKNRDQKTDGAMKDNQDPICLFYIQGKCNKGDECPYSHEVSIPMKLELCKFYLMECCAKGDKCLYMHSEFPCKFYHTGLRCQAGDSCKFAHGKPLHEGLKQILYKHIETAPKEILGDFPRMSRDGALNMINQAQKALEAKYAGDKKETTGSDASGRNIIPSLFELNIPVPTELLPKDAEKAKEKGEKPRERNRPSRWQDADPSEAMMVQDQQKQQLPMTFGLKGFYAERGDQDMRVNSNGDIDMRTLPPQLNPLPPQLNPLGPGIAPVSLPMPSNDSSPKVDIDLYMREAGLAKEAPMQDVDIRARPQDIDIRQLGQLDLAKDIDIRQLPQFDTQMENDDNDNIDEPNLEIDMDDGANPKTDQDFDGSKSDIDSRVLSFENKDTDIRTISEFPANLPKKQRELFLRIQAQQKENVPENQKEGSDDDKNNIDWYSDDDDDCRLTIKDDVEELPKPQKSEELTVPLLSTPIKPGEVIEKLGDLSKIDISAEVTKLLSSISQAGVLKETKVEPPKDPRLAAQTAEAPKPAAVPMDPRRARLGSVEGRKTEKLSIYEQGSLSIENAAKDVDLRDLDLRPIFGDTDLRPTPGRPDIDLRQLGLPFKAIQNYTPASEIDASINSHPPMSWKVFLVEIPRPDYTGLKLSAHEAQNTGDPRLRKIFRLSTEEKDSPASPKESTKATTGIRADPRRRREEKSTDPQMSYAQQLNMLQTSPFYQSLTSSQKVLLNEELATKSDHSGSNDPTLNGILTNLGLIPGPSMLLPNTATTANTSALSILASVNNMIMGQPNAALVGANASFGGQPVNPNILSQNPNIVNQMAQSIVQPGLLGAAPGVPNLPPDFQLNFDPRQGGLLGNAPPINYNDNSNFNNYNDEYYDGNGFAEGGGGSGGGRGSGRGGRGGFRGDRQQRRGRNFNSSRNSGRSFRNRNRSNRSRTPP